MLVVAPCRAVARKAGFLSAFHARVEYLVGLIDPAQYILAVGGVRQGQTTIGAHRLQLVGLIVVVDRLVARLPGVVAFLLGGVVERAGFLQFGGEERPGRVDPVFEGDAQLTSVCAESPIFNRASTKGSRRRKPLPLVAPKLLWLTARGEFRRPNSDSSPFPGNPGASADHRPPDGFSAGEQRTRQAPRRLFRRDRGFPRPVTLLNLATGCNSMDSQPIIAFYSLRIGAFHYPLGT